MTCLRARLASARCDLTGERSGVFLKGDRDEGVSLMPPGPPHAGLMIRELEGVSDMVCRDIGEDDGWRGQTCVDRRHGRRVLRSPSSKLTTPLVRRWAMGEVCGMEQAPRNW
jgi:hypothetical protein